MTQPQIDYIARVTEAGARPAAFAPRTLDALALRDADLRAVLEGRRHLLFDGAMGTMLQAAGLEAGALPELLCLTDPDAVTAVHRAYVEAGSEVVTTNTFGANRQKLATEAAGAQVEAIFDAAVACARAAGARYVAADIGPIGSLLRPLGTLSFDEAYELFAEQARAAAAAGADLIVIETMTDLLEIKAAVLAAKEQTSLPIFATMTFEADGRTFLGTSPEVAAVTLDALGADVIGINCSLGPDELAPLVERMLAHTARPVMVQANAGLPHVSCGRTVYDIHAPEYARAVAAMIEAGVSVVGGCCGTDPDYIRLLKDLIEGRAPSPRELPEALRVTSAQELVSLPAREHRIAVIGERINPTGKRLLKAALRDGDLDYLVGQGISQQEQGADILDVNVGLPGIDEAAVLAQATERLCAATTLPLQIDSTNARAIEAAVRRYAGVPIINSVSGKRAVMDEVFPIAAHYGAAVIGLALDEDGIPETAEGRFAVAEKIVAEAARWGIDRSRILIDCLVMTASTNQEQAEEILRAVTMCKERLGVKCALGVSNVSFGLPARELLNATFLAAALGAGLDAPIMNPGSERYMDAVRAYRVINGEDAGSEAFIERFGTWTDPYRAPAGGAGVVAAAAGGGNEAGGGAGAPAALGAAAEAEGADPLRRLVISGRKGEVPALIEELLGTADPMDLINTRLIPALDEVGERFDRGEFFLPQLMASAEAARAGFDTIKRLMPAGGIADKGTVALATVKGDIHDIGKNIVKMLLENYGYAVVDLGRDVDPQVILDTVRERQIRLVGLSALMTTTVASMEETIRLLRAEAPGVKIVVGGAVLTAAYAAQIGADYYAKDAAESARIAEEVFGG